MHWCVRASVTSRGSFNALWRVECCIGTTVLDCNGAVTSVIKGRLGGEGCPASSIRFGSEAEEVCRGWYL